jgi:sensor histidine kinase YesM
MVTKKLILMELRDLAILFALGITMTLTGLSCNDCVAFSKTFWIMATFTSLTWIFLWKGNSYLADYLTSKISWIEFPMTRFVVGLLVTAVYTLLAMFLLGAIYERSFDINIGYGIWFSVIITIIISLFMHSRAFLFNWKQTVIDAEKHQKETIAAKYESLKNQVNPHFLFNSLNALTNLVYEDQDKAVTFIKQLSEVYRYVLDTREKEVVALKEELDFLNSYLFLQKIRFGEKLNIDIRLQNVKSEVAPLALQMLIENAIKHNVVSEDDPLSINVYADEQYILVENNLQKKTTLGEPSSGIGLENICKRYEFLSTSKVVVEKSEQTFIVKLPRIPSRL